MSRDPLSRLIRMVTNTDADYMRARRNLPPPGDLSRRSLDEALDDLLEDLGNLVLGR